MIEKVDTSREAVRKTGTAFLIAGSAFAAVVFLGHSHVEGWLGWSWQEGIRNAGWKWLLGTGLGLFALSRFAYPLMKPIHFVWMKLALALGWISTRVVLGVFFYVILTPVGFVMRLFGKDLLNQHLDRSAPTYWIKRETKPFDASSYERLF